MGRAGAALLGLLLALSAGAASAHPHVWITVVSTFRFDGGKLVAVGNEWRFDPYFSDFVAQQFDGNHDGKLDAAEQQAVEHGAFAATRDFGWFTHLRIAGERRKWQGVRNFRARLENGVVVYDFDLVLPEPVDPEVTPVAVSPFDETYYVDVAPDEKRVARFVGRSDCRARLRDDLEPKIYFGMVKPPSLLLLCGREAKPTG